jgi:hypothetical protein
MESAYFYNTFFAPAPSVELPDDVLGIISQFTRPLKRRVVSCKWDETDTEEMMLDSVEEWLTDKAMEMLEDGQLITDEEDDLVLFEIDRKMDGNKWVFTVEMINIDGDLVDHCFALTFTRDELYRWDGNNYQTTHGYWWEILPDDDLVTQLQDDTGKVIRTI